MKRIKGVSQPKMVSEKKFAVSDETARIVRLMLKVDELYNEVEELMSYLYDDETAETIMQNDYNENFFSITEGLKDELAENIYSSLCNIENISDDVVEL